jgi:ferritin-like metal-binding protein YciE
MKEAKDDTIRDAAMLAAAQAVEHYEISRYGTLVAWAKKWACRMRSSSYRPP